MKACTSTRGALVLLGAAAFLSTLTWAGDVASAEVNCGVLTQSQARVSCYRAQADIYRRQAEDYNNIAREQYRMHERVGRGLRHAPIFGRYAAPAWNAPRYYYQYRYGRP